MGIKPTKGNIWNTKNKLVETVQQVPNEISDFEQA